MWALDSENESGSQIFSCEPRLGGGMIFHEGLVAGRGASAVQQLARDMGRRKPASAEIRCLGRVGSA